MMVAGKCPPEEEELRAAKQRGFESVELYLEKRHLDSFDETLESCRTAEVEIVSIHTPHVTIHEKGYFEKAGELAEELDAFLVFHSQFLHHVNIPELERDVSINADYGYENNPGISAHAIENLILGRGHRMVLDTAHLYIAEKDFSTALEQFLDNHSDMIGVVHVCDSTKLEDGLGFGEGEIDMERTCKAIAGSDYDGPVVLEVMPEGQTEALEKWRDWTS